jgi:hypothetical protein
LSRCTTGIKHWLQLPGSTAKSLPVKLSRSMKQSREKLVGGKTVSVVAVALAQVLDPARVVSTTRTEGVAATIAEMELVAYMTVKVEPGVASATEVEVGVALAQVVDQVGADVPTDPHDRGGHNEG